MDQSRIDFPEVSGKTVAELFVYDDPTFGREITVHFTDETQLSICVSMIQTVDARYSRDGEPERPLFVRMSQHRDGETGWIYAAPSSFQNEVKS